MKLESKRRHFRNAGLSLLCLVVVSASRPAQANFKWLSCFFPLRGLITGPAKPVESLADPRFTSPDFGDRIVAVREYVKSQRPVAEIVDHLRQIARSDENAFVAATAYHYLKTKYDKPDVSLVLGFLSRNDVDFKRVGMQAVADLAVLPSSLRKAVYKNASDGSDLSRMEALRFLRFRALDSPQMYAQAFRTGGPVLRRFTLNLPEPTKQFLETRDLDSVRAMLGSGTFPDRRLAFQVLEEWGAAPSLAEVSELRADALEAARGDREADGFIQTLDAKLQALGQHSATPTPELLRLASASDRVDAATIELAHRASPEARAFFEAQAKQPDSSGPPRAGFAQMVLLYRFGDLQPHRLYGGQGKHPLPADFLTASEVGMAKFEKTGSQTVLLGGPLAGKAIARIVSEQSARSWRDALGMAPAWKRAGFDYIPVEPILADPVPTTATAVRKELADRQKHARGKNEELIYAQVLRGPSVATALDPAYSGLFPAPHVMKNQVRQIRDVLDRAGLLHGHPHTNNFVLEYDAASGKDRLYLIDFDQASNLPSPTLVEKLLGVQ